jgi:hypothetical protein
MAKFKFLGNPNVVLEFTQPVDILTTRQHPEYVEIDDDGKELSARKDGTRPEWDIPMKPVGALKSAPKKGK